MTKITCHIWKDPATEKAHFLRDVRGENFSRLALLDSSFNHLTAVTLGNGEDEKYMTILRSTAYCQEFKVCAVLSDTKHSVAEIIWSRKQPSQVAASVMEYLKGIYSPDEDEGVR